jgi:hypothetical protein
LTMNDNEENGDAASTSPAGNLKELGLKNLYTNLTRGFGLGHDAAQFVIIIYHFAQFFDDVADGDAVKRSDLDLNVYNCFVGMNLNPFFVKNRIALLPVMDLILLKWQGSDVAERTGRANEKSFMWRAGFYDLLMTVVSIERGYEMAKNIAVEVMNFYGENLQDYKKEFNHG